MQHDFEDVEVKVNAPQVLDRQLRSRRNKCMLFSGSMSDPYMPIEEDLQLTRQCLEIIAKRRYGVCIQTKSDLILRDADLLCEINNYSKAVVQMTLTTADEDLCSLLEPNVCSTKQRVSVLARLAELGIPTVVWICPILPFINDTLDNISRLLDSCITAKVSGIIQFGMGVTLRDGNRQYFYRQLDKHFPQLLYRYQQRYGNSYELLSDNNSVLVQHIHAVCQQHRIMGDRDQVFAYLSSLPQPKQLSFLDVNE